jgi:hypothetical protein
MKGFRVLIVNSDAFQKTENHSLVFVARFFMMPSPAMNADVKKGMFCANA